MLVFYGPILAGGIRQARCVLNGGKRPTLARDTKVAVNGCPMDIPC